MSTLDLLFHKVKAICAGDDTGSVLANTLTALLLFDKEHPESDTEAICLEVVELLKRFDRNVKTFKDLCRKVCDYLESYKKVFFFKVPNKGTDGVFRVNVHLTSGDTFELELHDEHEIWDKQVCNVFHLTRNYETVVPCNTDLEVTYEEALELTEYICDSNAELVKKLLKVSW